MTSVMYHMKRYFDTSLNVSPTDIMYHLPTYHIAGDDDEPEKKRMRGPYTVDMNDKEAAEYLRERQLELIDGLTSLIARMNECLKKFPKRGAKEETIIKKDLSVEKNQLPQQKVPLAAFSYLKQRAGDVCESEHCIKACSQPSIAHFQNDSDSFAVVLTVTDDDQNWVDTLKMAAMKKNILITCGDSADKLSSTIQLRKGDKTQVTIDNYVADGRISLWKVVGSKLGIYPTSKIHSVLAAHIDRWLLIADRFADNCMPKDSIIRLLSSSLSRDDCLSSGFEVSIADIVIAGLLGKNCTAPNNVELWLKRVFSTFE
ncbi:hypothetical protein AB6A40_008163 [Gnathostoma spinigerum]|uniref:Aminoacyl tRNA synthase complex-interacting multifunctional protein 2 n=1 Tax=Gnathostoma spinigerum TaxID=75299 RepID=A0ABD6EW18_9BILA